MFSTIFSNPVTLVQVLICLGVAFAAGVLSAVIYRIGTPGSTKSMLTTLVILPAVVQVVITLVNGNIGAGIAVAGAFTLVRFRSQPGTAKDIAALFSGMAVGLALGMGYLWFAILFAVILNGVLLLLALTPIAEPNVKARHLSVVMPESIDYTTVFDEVFDKYLKSVHILKVKTTNLGSMFEIRYDIVLKDVKQEKLFIDELRCLNGNLPIVCGAMITKGQEI